MPSILNNPNGPTSRTLVDVSQDEKLYEEHLAATKDIICQLQHLTSIEKLLQKYLSISQVALVPSAIMIQLLTSIRCSAVTSGYIGGDATEPIGDISQLAGDVLRSSSSEVIITPTLDLKRFCALYCGENLRVETLGLLYATAARSYLYDIGHDEKRDNVFIRDMIRCSNSSLQLARQVSKQTNDFIIWLAHEKLQLTTLINGDASLSVWRTLGDLATDIYALGLHREVTYSAETTPFFLAECRRKTFVKSYHMDKLFAAASNRPPRISARHADCRLPLDLSEDELFANSPEVLDRARNNLSPDGWSMDGSYRPTTWARLRYILSQFREEIVEHQFHSSPSIDYVKLRYDFIYQL